MPHNPYDMPAEGVVLRVRGGALATVGETWGRLVDNGLRAPRYPGFEVVLPVEIPAASWEHTPDPCDLGQILPFARRMMLTAFAPRWPGYHVSAKALHKHDLLVSHIVTVMCNGRTPLAAWIAFSLDVWKGVDNPVAARGAPPTIGWLYSLSRYVKQREWFLSRAPGYCGRRLVASLKHRELLRAFDSMQSAVVSAVACLPPHDAVIVAQRIVDERVGAHWAARVEAARTDVQERQARVASRLKRGDYLW